MKIQTRASDSPSVPERGPAGDANPGASELAAIETAAIEWRVAFDTLPTPVFVFDAAHRIRRLNLPARKLVGLPYADIIGRPLGGEGQPPVLASFAEVALEAQRSGVNVQRLVQDRAGDQ